MKRKAFILLALACTAASFTLMNWVGGQTVNEEKAMRMMKEFVALEPNEVPGFDTKGGIVNRVVLGKGRILLLGLELSGGVSIELYQTLSRPSTRGKGEDEINIRACLLPDRDTAYKVALTLVVTQSFLPGAEAPGRLPEGSWTGLPIGEKSWRSVPEIGKIYAGISPTVNLVVWDDRLAVRVCVRHPPIDPMARTLVFLPVEREDLELGEMAARLIVVKANLVLLGWREIPKVRLVANGKEMEARKVREGLFLLPVSSLAKGMGWRFERRYGVAKVSFSGREVVLPMGSRELLVGGRRAKLALPVLWDGKELWAEGVSLAKGLGFALREKEGKLVLAKR